MQYLLGSLQKALFGGSGGRAWPALGKVIASFERRSSNSEYLYAAIVERISSQQDLSFHTSF